VAECQDLNAHNAKLFARLNTLIEGCRRYPFEVTGKSEPLGGSLLSWWSRRISHEHRLMYRMTECGEEQVLAGGPALISLLRDRM
jgi:toxin YoeB